MMKKQIKILLVLAFISIIIFSALFVCNTRAVTSLINKLNGHKIEPVNLVSSENRPQETQIKLVNTPAIGKYKINIYDNEVDGYTNIGNETIAEKCKEILNSKNKVILIKSKNNLDVEYFCALLQMIAGDDYDHIKDYFVSNFNENDYDSAKDAFDYYFSNEFQMEKNDLAYINLKKPAYLYLEKKGLGKEQIEELIIKVKENCEK